MLKLELRMPDAGLSPNSRVHWATRAGLKRQARQEAAWAAKAALGMKQPPRWHAVTAQATFTFKMNRRRDPDNLAAMLKPYWDGITDAGILIDIRLPQQDLADLVGTTRESVNKQLRSWEEEGLVKLERTRITIIERAGLEASAAFLTL